MSVLFLSLYLGNGFKVSDQTLNSKRSTSTEKNQTKEMEWDKILNKLQITLKEFLFKN